LNACQDHAVLAGTAHAERVVLEAMQRGVASAGASTAAVLGRLSALFALSRMHYGIGWFLEKGYVEGGKSRAIRDEMNRLCVELRPDAVALVEAFGIPEALLPPFARATKGS
jgi:acyl-CoA oxidase